MLPRRGSRARALAGSAARPAALGLALLPVLSGAPVPQDGRAVREAVDPYTEGDREAMAEAGYVRFGPFAFAANRTTETVEETLGGVPVLWVETEHFKLGSSLEPYTYYDHREREKIEDELKRLKRRLPGLRGRVRELDPWLRLHLFALRLEDLFASFVEEFGLEDETLEEAGAAGEPASGPVLGLRDKLAVLLLQKESSLARYTATYCGAAWDSSYRYFHPESGTFFFGIAMDSLTDSFHNDSALHYSVAFQVLQNLANGYRGYTHEAAPWWNEGLAHWFARRTDPRWLLYCDSKTIGVKYDEEESEWARKVRARVELDHFPSMLELLAKTSDDLEFVDHMMCWSRVDHLMAQEVWVRRDLLEALQDPAVWGVGTSAPSPEEAYDAVLRHATGLEPEALETEWARYVRRSYPRK